MGHNYEKGEIYIEEKSVWNNYSGDYSHFLLYGC